MPNSKFILNDDNCDAIEFAGSPNFDQELRSSMSPTLIRSLSSGMICSIGGKGSQKIPQGIAQAIINKVVRKMEWSESLAAKRVYYYFGKIQYEGNFKPILFFEI